MCQEEENNDRLCRVFMGRPLGRIHFYGVTETASSPFSPAVDIPHCLLLYQIISRVVNFTRVTCVPPSRPALCVDSICIKFWTTRNNRSDVIELDATCWLFSALKETKRKKLGRRC